MIRKDSTKSNFLAKASVASSIVVGTEQQSLHLVAAVEVDKLKLNTPREVLNSISRAFSSGEKSDRSTSAKKTLGKCCPLLVSQHQR